MVSKASFNKLKKIAPKKRVQMAQQPEGPSLLAALTPTQYAELFPKNYQRLLPDVGGFRAAMSQKTQDQQKSFTQSVEERIADIERKAGRVVKRARDKIDELKEDISEKVLKTSRVPGLSKEADISWRKLHQGDVGVDSEDGKVLSRLSDKQLDSIGVKRVKDREGKSVFHYETPTVSKEDVASRIAGSFTGREEATIRMISAKNREGSNPNNVLGGGEYGKPGKYGAPPKPLTEMTINEVIAYQQELRRNSLKDPKMAAMTNGKGSSAVGLGQFVEGTLRSNLKKMGIQEKDWDKYKFDETLQKKLILQNFRDTVGDPNDPKSWNLRKLGTQWDSFNIDKGRAITSVEISNVLQAGTQRATGDVNKLTKQQYDSLVEQMKSEKEDARKALLARDMYAYEKDHGMSHTESSQVLKNAGYVVDSSGHIQPTDGRLFDSKNATQCATLTKAFNPDVGRASGWKISRNDSLIKPGVAVATSMYNDSRGGIPGAGYHTGIALTAPDKDGFFYVLDQFSPNSKSSGQASIRKQNVNEYHHSGNYWGVINGNTSVSMDALTYASKLDAPKGVIDSINASIAGYQEKKNVNVAETNTQQVKESLKVEAKSITQLPTDPHQAAPEGYFWDLGKLGDRPKLIDRSTGKEAVAGQQQVITPKQQSDQTATVTKPAEKKPEGPKSFNLNQANLIAAIRQTDDFKKEAGLFASAVPDSTILNGFFADARTKKIMKDTGTTYDPSTGKITSKNPELLLKSFGDMDTSNILTPSKEKTATVGEKLQREFGVASAQAGELDLSDPNVRAAIKAQHEKGISSSNMVDYQGSKTASALGMSNEQYNAFRRAVTGIESGGGDWRNMKYNVRGGSSNRFAGAYQMGGGEIKDVAKRLGETAPVMRMGKKIVANEAFLNDPNMQERYFDEYMLSHHESLLRRNKKYREMSSEQQMHALAVSHNAGAGGASKWINTGSTTKDASGTDPKKYSQALNQQFAELKQQQETQVAAVQQTTAPTEQRSFTEKVQSAAGQVVGTPTSAAAETKPAPTISKPEGPEFPKSKPTETPTPPSRPAELKPAVGGPTGEASTKSFLQSQGIGVPSRADGGEVNVKGQVSAYPINGLRGDNTLAVDTKTQQPLFTFNPQTEAVMPNGQGNRADVVPTNKVAQGPLTPNQHNPVMTQLDALRTEMGNAFANIGQQPAAPQQQQKAPIPNNPDPNFINKLLHQGQTPYDNPTFRRAMMRTSAQKETDDLHGHWSSGTQGM